MNDAQIDEPIDMAARKPLRVMTVNTHATEALTSWLVDLMLDLDVHLAFLQEINGDQRWHRVPDLFGRDFHVVPDDEHRVGQWAGATPILARKNRFEVLSQSNPQVTEWLGGGKHGALHPTRYRTAARLADKVTGRQVVGHSVHTWVMGRESWDAEHVKQVRGVAASCQRRAKGRVVFAGGDWNENLNKPVRSAEDCRAIMRAAGMVRAGERLHMGTQTTSTHGGSWLDDVFFRNDGIAVPQHLRIINVHSDHFGVLVDFGVLPVVGAHR